MKHSIGTRSKRVAVGSAFLLLSLGLLAAPAWAQGGRGSAEVAGADLDGCLGRADSFTEDEKRLGVAEAPGAIGASQSDPLLVEWEGPVDYSGASEEVIKNHSWQVRVYGIPVRTGGSENAKNQTETEGTEVMSDFLPFEMVGLYYVDGEIEGDGGAGCSGAIWLKLQGNPIGTIPWLVGAALTVGGVALMATTVRPSLVPASDQAQAATADTTAAPVAVKKKRHPISGLLVGLFLGLGASLVMISHSFAPFGRWTVIAMVAALAIAGAALGTAGPPRDKTKKMRRRKGPKGPGGSDARAAADQKTRATSSQPIEKTNQ